MKAPNKEPMLSVIVPVWRDLWRAERCLRELRRLLAGLVGEIIVVVDDSGGPSRFSRRGRETTIFLPDRRGPAAARNVGGAVAKEDFLLFVDADVVVTRRAVTGIREAIRSAPEIVGVFGSYDALPAAPGFVSQFRNLLHHHVHQRAEGEAATFWAGFGAIRRDVFLANGGFDERYERPSIEDIELGRRLTARGHRLVLRSDLQVKHLKEWSFGEMVRTDICRRALPWSRLIVESESGIPDDLNTRWGARASFLLVVGFVLMVLASPFVTWLAPVAGMLLIPFVLLNRSFLGFLRRERGLIFTLRAVPLLALFFGYSGAVFVGVWLSRRLGIARLAPAPAMHPDPAP